MGSGQSTQYKATRLQASSLAVYEATNLKLLRHPRFRRSLECQYGLLDHLLQNGCLTIETVKQLKQRISAGNEPIDELINRIDSENLNKFIEGLRNSNQNHLANFLITNGKRYRQDDDNDDWPLRDNHIEVIKKLYTDLVRDLYAKELTEQLFTKGCLNSAQKDKILSIHFTPQERNRALLDIMMQRSFGQLKLFIDCLETIHANYWKQLSDVICFRSTVDIVKPNDEYIRGIAVVDDEIFLVGWSHMNVYDSHSLTASRDINIPDMKSPQGLAGCAYNRALYISDDSRLKCIHRVDLTNNSVTRWEMRENHRPLGLSVTAEHTLLVTVGIRGTEGESRVVEYTSEGQLMREIIFDRSIEWAWRTVQLSSDQFIVSHGGRYSSLHRVCVINAEGQIIKSFGREWGEGEDQLDEPVSLAIDEKSKHVFVADSMNDRVLMFDSELMTRLGEVHVSRDLRRPSRLYFDSSTDRLFVAEFNHFSPRLLVVTHPELND